jgi:hypothetical protein
MMLGAGLKWRQAANVGGGACGGVVGNWQPLNPLSRWGNSLCEGPKCRPHEPGGTAFRFRYVIVQAADRVVGSSHARRYLQVLRWRP